RVVATDLNPHALRLARARAAAERLPIALVRTDLARGLGRFDRVVFNPPYLPTAPEERDPDRWHNLALDGGPDGTGPVVRWVASLADHLGPGGAGFALVSSLQARPPLARAAAAWRARGGTVEPVAERSFDGERLEVWRWAAPDDRRGPR
ncbi:methylase, partial [mine drainage metagenome]